MYDEAYIQILKGKSLEDEFIKSINQLGGKFERF